MSELPDGLMAFRRPDAVQELIAQKFESTSQFNGGDTLSGTGRYEYYGNFPDYYYPTFDFGTISAVNLVQQTVQGATAENLPLHVADIGTAHGVFLSNLLLQLEPGEVQLTGVSAYDYRISVPDRDFGDINYLVGNIESPETVAQLGNVSMMFTEYCMMHLADPLGTLEMLLNQLEPGGQFVMDYADILGLDFEDLRAHCNDAGFAVSDNSYGGKRNISFLHVTRQPDATEPLLLPFDYGASYPVVGELVGKQEYVSKNL